MPNAFEDPATEKAPENMDTVQTIALLQSSASDKLEEAMTADGRSTEELLQKLAEAKQANAYDERRNLTEVLRQRLDIADIRGEERPKAILDALASVYAKDEYSELRQKSIMDEIPKDNSDAIVCVLLDQRFSNSKHILYSLEDIEIREKIYQDLKQNNTLDKAVTLVSTTRDMSTKTRLFEDLATWLPYNSSDEGKELMGPYGGYNYLKKEVASKLLEKERETFYRLLEGGAIDIDGLESNLKDEPDEVLTDVLMHVITIDDASRILKFIHNKETILTAIPELDQAALPPESRTIVTETMQRLANSFDAPPQIAPLGYLRERDESMASYVIPNKFIIALRDGDDHATIAWSNTHTFLEHKQLAKSIGNVPSALCSGGQIEIVKTEGKPLQVTFEGRSGAYGPYNKTYLERFKQAMTEELQRELGPDIEVVINQSKT
ncbi:MAG: hypothetical protein UT02_C0002G0045 [Parcubacteria group bacterium GW2011_GWC2_38_7]|nr:MAG: hypothetical protein UT02_C0002G0045 [Parcubacteria group bacterium GW2011_GWC2_38_7]